jgi:outer membrane murein-binding lipoprotein Lpp
MRNTVAVIVAIAALTIAGCKSKQDQLVELNAQFDSLNSQYQKNCILAPVEVLQRTQAQCKTERDKMNPLGKKIIALQADIDASKH